MSSTVDNKVVQMTFDNNKFERGAEETLSTLDKLKRALNFDDNNSFDKLGKAANDVSFSGIESKLDILVDRFSGLGIVGMRIWEHIGDAAWDFATGALSKVTGLLDTAINQAKTGGWARALNLEKASFMINNLGYAWDETSENYKEGMETIKTSVDKAVSGTAYSLDEAAVASSNFLATGVKGGQELTDTLRSVMGVASTYSKDFSQIARVWQNVSARGYLMYGDISDLQANGVAAADVLKEYLNLTSEELDQAYKDKAIDFDTFRQAFLEKFGDSLDKANETYEGSLSNLKSAISRIGAEIASPLLENLIPLLNSLRILANNIKTLLIDFGFYSFVNNTIGGILEKVNSLITYEEELIDDNGKVQKQLKVLPNLLTVIGNFVDMIVSVMDILDTVFHSIGRGFKQVFGDNEGAFVNFTTMLADLLGNIAQNYINAQKITDVSVVFFTVLKKIFAAIKMGVKVVISLSKALYDFATSMWSAFKNSKAFEFIAGIFDTIRDKINTFLFIVDLLKNRYKHMADAFGEDTARMYIFDQVASIILGSIQKIIDKVNEVLGKFNEWTGLDLHIPSVEEIATTLSDFFTNIKNKATEAKDALVNAITNPNETLQNVKENITSAAETVVDKLGSAVGTVGEKLGLFTNWVLEFKNGMGDAKDAVVDFADTSEDSIEGSEKTFSIFDTLKTGLDKLLEVLGKIKDFAVKVGSGAFEIIKDIFNNVADVVGDMSIKDVFELIKAAIAFVIAVDFDTLLKKAQTFIDGLSSLMAPINTKVLAYKNKFRSIGAMVLEIGMAVFLISVAIGKLVEMDTDKAQKAVKIIAEVVGVMAGIYVVMGQFMKTSSSLSETMDKAGKNDFIHRFSKTTKDFDNGAITGFGKTLLEMAAAIWVISEAIANLGDIDVDKLLPIMESFGAGLAGMIAAIFGVGKIMQGMPADFIKSMSFAIIELSIAVFIMSKAMKSLGELNKDQMDTALVGFSAIVALITAFVAANEILGKTKVGESGPSWIALGISLMLLSTAIDLILPAMFTIGKMSDDELTKALGGLLAIVGLFGIIEVINAIVNKVGGASSILTLAAAATAFVELAFAIDALIPAVLTFAYMDPDKLVQGVLAVATLTGAFAYLAVEAGKNSSIKGLAAIVIITLAVSKLADVVSQLSLIKEEKLLIVGGLIASFGALFLLFAKVAKENKIEKTMMSVASSMLVFSASIVLLATSLSMLAKIDLLDLVKGLAAIAVAIAAFIAAAYLIKKLNLGYYIAELGASMLSIGAAAFLTGAGLSLLCLALTMLPAAIATAIEGISLIFDAISDLAYSLANSIDTLKDSVTEIVKDLVELLLAGVIGALEGIDEQLEDLINVVVDIVLKIINGITDRLDDIVPALFDFILTLLDETGKYLQDNKDKVVDSIESIIAGILEVLLEFVTRFKDFGEDLCWGILNGMTEFEWYNKLVDWVEKHIIAPICDFLGIHSPSTYAKEHIGFNFIAGLWDAFIEKGKEIFDNITSWVADNIIAPIANFFKKILDTGKKIIDNFKKGISNGIDNVKKTVTGVLDGIKQILSDPLGGLKKIGTSLMDGFATSISNKVEFVKGHCKIIADAVTSTFTTMQNGVEGLMETMFGDIEAEQNKRLEESQKELDRVTEEIRQRKNAEGNEAWNNSYGEQYLVNYYDSLYKTKKMAEELRRLSMDPSATGAKKNAKIMAYYKQLENLQIHYDKLKETVMDTNYLFNNADYGKAGNAFANEIGKNLIDGYSAAFSTGFSDINSPAYQYMLNEIEEAKKALGIASPSKVFRRIGEFVIDGYINGVDGGKDGMEAMMTSMVDMLNDPKLYDFTNPVITPVLDFSEIQNGGGMIDSLLNSKQVSYIADMNIRSSNRNSDQIEELKEAMSNLLLKTDNSSIEERLSAQNDLITILSNKLDSIGVYLDSGAIVGGITSKMDKALGFKAGMVERSVHA